VLNVADELARRGLLQNDKTSQVKENTPWQEKMSVEPILSSKSFDSQPDLMRSSNVIRGW